MKLTIGDLIKYKDNGKISVALYRQLFYENIELERKLYNIQKLLIDSISGIDYKLKINKCYRNDYQIARLKAIRMKCKEILDKFYGGI